MPSSIASKMSGEAGAAQAMAAQKVVERMLNAVQKGNVAELKSAINTLGCKTPNAVHAVRDGMGRGLLHYAAQFGQCQMIQHLVNQMDFTVDDQDSAGTRVLRGHIPTLVPVLDTVIENEAWQTQSMRSIG